MGESPGLVAMGGDSCSSVHEFKSQHWIMDRHFSHSFVVKNVRPGIVNEREAGNRPFKIQILEQCSYAEMKHYHWLKIVIQLPTSNQGTLFQSSISRLKLGHRLR